MAANGSRPRGEASIYSDEKQQHFLAAGRRDGRGGGASYERC